MKLNLIPVLLMTAQVGTAAQAPDRGAVIGSAVAKRFCPVSDEKVGPHLLPKPSTDQFEKMDSGKIPKAVLQEIQTYAETLRLSKVEITNAIGWRIKAGPGNVEWLLISCDATGQYKNKRGTTNTRTYFLAFAFDPKKSANRYVLHEGYGEGSIPGMGAESVPPTIEPYAMVDLDGDGINEGLLRQSAGYGQGLMVYDVTKSTWSKIMNACEGGD